MDNVDKEFEDLKPSNNLWIKLTVIGGLVLVVFLGILVTIKGHDPLKEVSESNFIEINEEKFYDLYESSEKFVLLLGRPDCSHCTAFKPVITKYANDRNIKVYYIDLYNIETEEDFNFIWGLLEQDGTPAMGVIENKKLINSTAGEMTRDELDIWFKNVGVL